MYPPGLRLRQTRETLGLTYREVEQASYELAANGQTGFHPAHQPFGGY